MAHRSNSGDHATVTPYLIVHDAAGAIEFYKRAFGAAEATRLAEPDGRVGHAEIRIGRSLVMLADEFPELGFRGPQALGGSPVSLLLSVDDVDKRFSQALAAGATVGRPVQDHLHGARTGTLTDPFGHVWTLATHKEDISPEELQRRYAASEKQQGSA
jgi:PhnB protein